MRPLIARADQDGLPCYLETHNARNLPLYGQFGFRTIAESLIPGSRVRQWSMVRRPP